MPYFPEGSFPKQKMRFLQINLNHCEAAQDLLYQEVKELDIDVAIIAEPYRVPANGAWISDKQKWSAIFICGSYPIQEVITNSESGVVAAKINGINIFSCYAPPRLTTPNYLSMLEKMADNTRGKHPIIIAGDFNAWSTEWGSRCTNSRGNILLDTFARVDVSLANYGTNATFRKQGRESIIDLTFVSSSLHRNLNWRVSERFTNSDHQAILYETDLHDRRTPTRKVPEKGWSTKWFDADVFRLIINDAILPRGPANEMAKKAEDVLTAACNASLPKKSSLQGQTRVFWWTETINQMRKACTRARRLFHRGARGAHYIELRIEYKQKRKTLRDEIRNSKKRKFQELCRNADDSPWGSAYRTVMSKIKGKRLPQEKCPTMLLEIVRTLFPQHALRQLMTHPNVSIPLDDIMQVTADEILEAARRVGTGKAPGPNRIPNLATKEALMCRPQFFADLMQACLEEGSFPTIWKRQRLTLLPKPGKSPGIPSSYRPICLLDTLGKILERIIQNRLLPITEGAHGLSDHQYGFRRARSTVDAIATVVNFVRSSTRNIGVRSSNQMLCAVITLDIKNAFNSASWEHIMRALRMMQVPQYIQKILDNYLNNRVLLYETDEGTKEYNITSGVPQGSVLGPLLWNIMYNGVLELTIPDGVEIVGFADDIAILVKSKHLDEIEMLANEAIASVSSWLQSRGLELAEQKTEAVLITKRKRKIAASFTVGVHQIQTVNAIKYLGVMLDDRLTFAQHIENARRKAGNAQAALARMMPNVGGPKSKTRLLISSVVKSILLYASPIWADALTTKSSLQNLNAAYRQTALRVISGYRTISSDAAYVIAGMRPIDLTAVEAKQQFEARRSNTNTTIDGNDSETWQQRWDSSSSGRWTHRLIPNIRTWQNRTHGELNFQLTQFISGHGGFAKYLHRFALLDSSECPACPGLDETPEHVVFACHRFNQERADIVAVAGEHFNPEQLVGVMLQSMENWSLIAERVTQIVDVTRRTWSTSR